LRPRPTGPQPVANPPHLQAEPTAHR
jgi:hypothetical protein